MRYLNIGGPIALAIIGAVLYFAVSVDVSGVNISIIGLILLGAAVIWLVVGIIAAAAASSQRTKEAEVKSNPRRVE